MHKFIWRKPNLNQIVSKQTNGEYLGKLPIKQTMHSHDT